MTDSRTYESYGKGITVARACVTFSSIFPIVATDGEHVFEKSAVCWLACFCFPPPRLLRQLLTKWNLVVGPVS